MATVCDPGRVIGCLGASRAVTRSLLFGSPNDPLTPGPWPAARGCAAGACLIPAARAVASIRCARCGRLTPSGRAAPRLDCRDRVVPARNRSTAITEPTSDMPCRLSAQTSPASQGTTRSPAPSHGGDPLHQSETALTSCAQTAASRSSRAAHDRSRTNSSRAMSAARNHARSGRNRTDCDSARSVAQQNPNGTSHRYRCPRR